MIFNNIFETLQIKKIKKNENSTKSITRVLFEGHELMGS